MKHISLLVATFITAIGGCAPTRVYLTSRETDSHFQPAQWEPVTVSDVNSTHQPDWCKSSCVEIRAYAPCTKVFTRWELGSDNGTRRQAQLLASCGDTENYWKLKPVYGSSWPEKDSESYAFAVHVVNHQQSSTYSTGHADDHGCLPVVVDPGKEKVYVGDVPVALPSLLGLYLCPFGSGSRPRHTHL